MTETQQELFARLNREKLAAQRKDFSDLQEMEAALSRVVAHLTKRNNAEQPHRPYVDPRQAAIARTHFEEGFRALYIGLGATLTPPQE